MEEAQDLHLARGAGAARPCRATSWSERGSRPRFVQFERRAHQALRQPAGVRLQPCRRRDPGGGLESVRGRPPDGPGRERQPDGVGGRHAANAAQGRQTHRRRSASAATGPMGTPSSPETQYVRSPASAFSFNIRRHPDPPVSEVGLAFGGNWPARTTHGSRSPRRWPSDCRRGRAQGLHRLEYRTCRPRTSRRWKNEVILDTPGRPAGRHPRSADARAEARC